MVTRYLLWLAAASALGACRGGEIAPGPATGPGASFTKVERGPVGPLDLAEAVMSARVSLGRGLAVSARQGQPISGKFEMAEGELQLSVYTAKGGTFFEVIVDPNSGKVVQAEPITGSDDLAAAQSQSAAMAKAKVPLRAAVERALRGNAGFRAVSVTPSLKDGRAVADVMLTNGETLKSVSVPLHSTRHGDREGG